MTRVSPPEDLFEEHNGVLQLHKIRRPEFSLPMDWLITEWVSGSGYGIAAVFIDDVEYNINFVDAAGKTWVYLVCREGAPLSYHESCQVVDEVYAFSQPREIAMVPILGALPRPAAVDACLKGMMSPVTGGVAKGIVARPLVNIYDAQGKLIWWRLRHDVRTEMGHGQPSWQRNPPPRLPNEGEHSGNEVPPEPGGGSAKGATPRRARRSRNR